MCHTHLYPSLIMRLQTQIAPIELFHRHTAYAQVQFFCCLQLSSMGLRLTLEMGSFDEDIGGA